MLLVIVHDLDFVNVALSPHEAETPLVVNPNAILPFAIPMQCLQAIAGRSCQIAQFRGAVQLPKLSPRNALNSPKAPAGLPTVKSPGFGAAERLDHGLDCIVLSV
jgi:hypothetical protein